MSTLKQLRLRINGIKSTQKITKTMQMIAASKLLKAQEQKDQAKPYADNMYKAVAKLANSVSSESEVANLLVGTGKDHIHLLVAVGSDKGLCGGFNTSIVRNLKKYVDSIEKENKEFKIICIGKKVFEQIKSLYKKQVIEVLPSLSNEKINYTDAKEIASKIITLFNSKEFDICTFIYGEFQNAIRQVITNRRLIPLNQDMEFSNHQTKTSLLFEYEPDEEKMLEQILPLNLAVQVYYTLLESAASEQGARMTAMDAATKNASEMISKLTLQYNRSRQAAITKELIEIISSAEVV